MVGVSAIAGFVLLVGSAGRIPPEETWCWETRLRQCYPAVLPAITVAHSEVMIGKPRDPYPAQYCGENSLAVVLGPVGGARIPLDIFLRFLCGIEILWDLAFPRTEGMDHELRTHCRLVQQLILAQISHQTEYERSSLATPLYPIPSDWLTG